MITTQTHQQNDTMRSYYRFHALIYNMTRWSFLFGRKALIRNIPLDESGTWTMLEVGCGTGYNLSRTSKRFPKATLHGLDVSADMLRQAEKNLSSVKQVSLHEKPYQLSDDSFEESLDAIIISYALTMINPQWEEIIQRAALDLKPGGIIAVADFHDSRFPWFKTHMGNNHVRMDGHLMPVLQATFDEVQSSVQPAYGGVWEYMEFIGRKA